MVGEDEGIHFGIVRAVSAAECQVAHGVYECLGQDSARFERAAEVEGYVGDKMRDFLEYGGLGDRAGTRRAEDHRSDGEVDYWLSQIYIIMI